VGGVEGGAVGVSTEEAVGCAEGEDGADCAASALGAAGALPLAAEEAELASDALVAADAVGAAFAVGVGEALAAAGVPVNRAPVAVGGAEGEACAEAEGMEGAEATAEALTPTLPVARAGDTEGSALMPPLTVARAGDTEGSALTPPLTVARAGETEGSALREALGDGASERSAGAEAPGD
jgi:hypothetical protein